MNSKGKLIAAMGLPGSGKSSLISRAASKSGAHCFLEPEESEWTDAVNMRDRVGHFTAITWFRSVRVPFLYKADNLRTKGEIAFVDSYYDKLISRYLGRPGMEWLISPSDKYYHIIDILSRIDYDELPDADCLISFRVSEKRWHDMLSMRDRALDKATALHETFHTQQYFMDAAEEYCQENGIPHVVFDNKLDGLETATESLLRQLTNVGVLQNYE